MKRIFLPVLMLAMCVNAFAQDIAISEYKDSQGTALGEWTELVVLKDRASLSNFILQDNNGTDLTNWSGGIRFPDIPIWRDLRRGTIIVIHHRDIPNTTYDYDISDGYVEMPATDNLYFEQYSPEISGERTWDDKALSINEERDILELINGNSAHIHSLSHSADVTGSIWRTLPEPKPNCNASLSSGKSVAIYPGSNANSYAGTGGNLQVIICDNPTLGLPNSSNNSLFWRKLREPSWDDVAAQVSLGQYGTRISWSKSAEVRSDTDGYMIVRFRLADSANIPHPKDGHVYEVGERIGDAVVLTNVGGNISYDYYDNTDLPCNIPIAYRIYAYRFKNSGATAENTEENARGRQYQQENYAQVSIEKNGPEPPEIFADGDTTFCEGDSVVLSVRNPQSNYEYKWLKNSIDLDGSNGSSLVVHSSGKYAVSAYDTTYHCNATSDEIEVRVIHGTEIELSVNDKKIENDTSVYVCSGEGLILSCNAENVQEVSWYLDGRLINENTDRIIASETGKYRVEIEDGEVCSSISPEVDLTVKTPHIDFAADTVEYLASTFGTVEIGLVFTNPDDYDIWINPAFISNNLTIQSPEMPCVIPAHSNITITLQILNYDAEGYKQLEFRCECSDEINTIVLHRIIVDETLVINKSEIDFGKIATCTVGGKTETITLANYGDEVITLLEPITNSPFSLSGAETFPITLAKDEIKSITVKFDTNSAGLYRDTLVIPYKISGLTFRDSVLLTGVVEEIDYAIAQTQFTLSGFSAATPTQEITIPFSNIGTGEIIVELPNVPGVEFPDLPMTVQPGETVNIHALVTIPDSVWLYTFTFDLLTNPCGTSSKIEISCSVGGILANNTYFDFGYLPNCDELSVEDKYLKLYAIDTIMTVQAIEQAENFRIDIAIGDEISDSSTFAVHFLGNREGVYQDSARITFLPDYSAITISFNAVIEDFKSDLPEVVVMPQTIIHTVSDTIITIKNDNSFTILLKEIIGCQSPFRIVNPNALPQTLLPGDVFDLEIEFDCNDYLANSCDLSFLFEAGECEYVKDVTLYGRAENNDSSVTVLKMEILAPQQVTVGQTLNVPVRVTGFDSGEFASYGLDSVAFDLSYNRRTSNPKAVILSTGNSTDTLQSTLASAGVIRCSGSLENFELSDDSVFCYIVTDIYLGNSDSAYLAIENVEILSDRNSDFLCSGDTALMQIIGNCAYETGLLDFGNLSAMTVKENGKVLDIDYSVTDENESVLQVIDLSGKILYEKIFTCKQGNYSVTMELPSRGVYFAILRNGNFPRICKFIVQ